MMADKMTHEHGCATAMVEANAERVAELNARITAQAVEIAELKAKKAQHEALAHKSGVDDLYKGQTLSRVPTLIDQLDDTRTARLAAEKELAEVRAKLDATEAHALKQEETAEWAAAHAANAQIRESALRTELAALRTEVTEGTAELGRFLATVRDAVHSAMGMRGRHARALVISNLASLDTTLPLAVLAKINHAVAAADTAQPEAATDTTAEHDSMDAATAAYDPACMLDEYIVMKVADAVRDRITERLDIAKPEPATEPVHEFIVRHQFSAEQVADMLADWAATEHARAAQACGNLVDDRSYAYKKPAQQPAPAAPPCKCAAEPDLIHVQGLGFVTPITVAQILGIAPLDAPARSICPDSVARFNAWKAAQ
ncbi:hypothetical protein [Pseudomonas sp.]|uniref:hypothetical protein n=1 Tax=Pseudomonas sp. TaxID=306 RepID=UPI00262690B5|nr:hypothetical protein [Pseudomonas sp.]